MSDETHDEERNDTPVEGEDSQPEVPPPSTWAGRKRSGGVEPEAELEDPSGLTAEFDSLETELAAELAGDEDEPEVGDEDEPEVDDADEPEVDDADLAEDPPDEFEFEDDEDGEEAVEEEDEEPAEEAAAATPPVGATTEADTLAISDEEAAREAAHAGLRARTATEAARRGLTVPTGEAVVPPVASVATASTQGDGTGDAPPARVWWRFVAATFVIIASMAAATSVSFLLFLSDIADGLGDSGAFNDVKGALENVEPGEPQTIMILGSDKRSGTPGDPGRSDTTLLLRVDPDKGLLALLSLPRDLKVTIPGYGTDKLNAAYSYGEQAKKNGGPELTLKTVKDLLGIPINHVVNVDFTGFYEAVNAIDCVYIDVDREYFHSNEGLFGDQLYAEIDVPAGYSKLCGYTALQFVRYRHEDNDLVRGARQQDFVREARQRIPPRKLLPVFGEGNELIEIFKDYTTSDIDDVATIIDMLETFISVRNAEVRQVDLGEIVPDGGVEATNEQVEASVDMFLGTDIDPDAASADPVAPEKPAKREKRKDKPKQGADAAPSVIDSTGAAQTYSAEFTRILKRRKAKLPVYQPTAILSQSEILDDSRVFEVAGFDNRGVYRGYKFVMSYPESGFSSYYGVSGVNWLDAPILDNPSETRNVEGRNYLLFYQADKLRLVGWKTEKGSYWVNNTLTQSLSEAEMLEIATGVRDYVG